MEQLTLPLDQRPRTRAIPPRAIVVLSGGQDSTTCLYWALDLGFQVHAVTFDYGQRHSREIRAATRIASQAKVQSHEIISAVGLLRGSSPLVSGSPLAQYEHHSKLPGGLEKTFVPMRNQLFLTIAANRAAVLDAETIITGVCEEDYGGYPDCRQQFIHAFAHACNLGTFTGENGAPKSIAVLTPLMHLTKAASVRLALDLEGCYNALSYSHTGYDGKYPPTGKDHATLLRQKGFEEADVPDPLVLRAFHENQMDLPSTRNYRPSMVEFVLKKFNLVEYWENA